MALRIKPDFNNQSSVALCAMEDKALSNQRLVTSWNVASIVSYFKTLCQRTATVNVANMGSLPEMPLNS